MFVTLRHLLNIYRVYRFQLDICYLRYFSSSYSKWLMEHSSGGYANCTFNEGNFIIFKYLYANCTNVDFVIVCIDSWIATKSSSNMYVDLLFLNITRYYDSIKIENENK